MHIVYILKSLKDPSRYYIGLTQNLRERVATHNADDSYYSKRYAPWDIETYISFKNEKLAVNFEKYLKNGSGHAFLKKRFLEPLDRARA